MMDVFSYVKKYKFPFKIGQEIGYGADGQVFSVDEKSVVKIGIIYNYNANLQNDLIRINNIYNYLLNNKNKCFVDVLEFKEINNGYRNTIDGKQEYVTYYVLMEKLDHLSDDEKKAFKTICDMYNKEDYTNRDIKKIIDELSFWLDFDVKNIKEFWDTLGCIVINHNDVHRRNIMKDIDSNYKLIDFDRAYFK